MYNYFAKIIVFILFIIVIISCNATKRVPEGKYLLTKNNIIVNDKKTSDPEISSYLKQAPNTKVLGFPFSLHLYNMANTTNNNSFNNWLEKNPKKEKKLISVFSRKQVKALGKAYKGINSWFIKNGNSPVISDSIKVKKSVISLTKYMQSKGFFDAEVSFKQDKKSNKKTSIDYLIEKREPYFIDSVSVKIDSPVLDSLYKLHKEKSLVVGGNQIDYSDFEKEEARLITLFRNSGVYHFGKNNMRFWLDTIEKGHKIDVYLKVDDRILEQNDSIFTEPFEIKRVTKVNVYTDFLFDNKNDHIKDSASYKGYNFYANNKINYKPKYLSNAISIQPGGVYKDTERDLTRKHLRELQNFKPSLNIKYDENKDGSLSANIFLSPLKKYSFGFDNEYITSNIKPFGILGKFSWLDRNVFRGAEVLELSFQGSFLNSALDPSNNSSFLGLDAWEIGSNATLKIPRILFPLNTTRLIPKRMAPKTNISASVSIQRNVGLDRRNITGGINYTWQSSKTTNHKFELLNVQYIKNLRTDKYFSIFVSESRKLDSIAFGLDFNNITPDITEIDTDGNLIDYEAYMTRILESSDDFEITNPIELLEVQKVNERKDILVEDVLVPVISYTYNYNNRDNFTDNNFSSFTGRLISSGTITSLFIKKPAGESKKKLFGLRIAQYIKPEIEFKKYWSFGPSSTLVHRTFVGAAIPFGNSDVIPFSRSYRAGGSNDIRAWNTFRLGPGSELNGLEFNTGSLKLTSNLEYRFKVINSFHSALFIDAGNIWDITNSNITSSDGKFNGFSSIKDIAIGSGFGIRYDFSFLVFRFDIGFKTYEPYLQSSDKWLKNYNFNHAVYNIGINYPF